MSDFLKEYCSEIQLPSRSFWGLTKKGIDFIVKDNNNEIGNEHYEFLRKHPAYEYAKDIVDGKILSNVYIKKECQRFLNMIDNPESRLYQKYFVDIKSVNTITQIVRMTNFSTGEFAGQPCIEKIAGFQWYILINIYATKLRDKPLKRRFEKACVFISRKNAKTWIVSMFMILALLFEPDYAQLVAAANTREQAKILFAEIKKTLEVSPMLKKNFKILNNTITCLHNNNYLFAVSGDARTMDGKLVSVGCVDEYGAAKNSAVYDSLQTSMLATINRLLFTISTAYPYPENPMKELIEYGHKVLDDIIEDDKFFLMWYGLDVDDDWTDEKCWIKANPLQACSELGMDFLRGECKMALEMPAKQMSFKTKNLNIWLDGDESINFVSHDDIKKCTLEKPYDWEGREVYVGVDMALTNDNCGVTMVTHDKELDKYVAKSWAFFPADRMQYKSKIEKVDYDLFTKQGYCFPCGDSVVSHRFIEDFVMNLKEEYGVKVLDIGYDRFNCVSSANRWYDEGELEVTEIKQHSSVLHAPTKFLRDKMLTGGFAFDKNKLLEINFSNAKTVEDNNLNFYINKKKSNGKIDMVAALINAMYFWEKIHAEGEEEYSFSVF